MAARPDTPPGTPTPGKGTGPGRTDVGGNVDFKGADIKNSIATGHIHGYEVILATINITVDAANNLTKNIQEFAAKVDLKLHLLSFKVGSTAGVLSSINALVVKQAKRKGLTVDREVKVLKETRKKPDSAGEILSMTCFQAIIEGTKGVHEVFDDISEKIKRALKTIGLLQKLHQDGQEAATGVSVRGPGPDAQQQPGTPKGKVTLSDKTRKEVYLTEEDLVWMEKTVEIHFKDLWNRFIIFEYSLDDERREKQEEDTESIKLIVKNTWKEMKRLAEYLFRNGEPPRPLDEFRGPQSRASPEARRRYLPKSSRVNSLYLGWEFRKSLPITRPNPYYHLDQLAQKPSWSFAVPQRMPFSTEELFLRVLAQATQRAKSDRTLRDDYWSVLKKAGQRALVDELVQSQNHHLQRDFPELEWTIAGLDTKIDPWALMAAHAGSRAREKKKRNAITAFEVILKTQWRIARGYGPPMPFPGGIGGPAPVGPSRLGHLPGDGRSGPPDGYRPQSPRGPLGGPPFASGGDTGDGQGVPIIITPDYEIYGGSQRVPQIPVHIQTRQCKPTRSRHRPKMVLHEPNWVLVKEGAKRTKKSKDEEKMRRHKDSGDNNRQKTRKPRVYVEFREAGRDHRTAAAGPSGVGHRPQSPPGPGIPYRPPFVPPLRPAPPPMPLGGFVPADGGRRRTHIPPVPQVAHPPPPVARPPSPQPTHIHMASAQTQREEEEEEEEAEEVVEEILEEFSELTDTKGKKNERRRRRQSEWNMQVPDGRYRMERESMRRQDAEPDVSISRSLMRQVERASCRRLAAEGEELHVKSVRLERMAERQAPPPPSFEVPGPTERTRLAREREPRVVHRAEPPPRPYMEVERGREERRQEERDREMRVREERRRGDIEREVRERAEREQEAREQEVRELVDREREQRVWEERRRINEAAAQQEREEREREREREETDWEERRRINEAAAQQEREERRRELEARRRHYK